MPLFKIQRDGVVFVKEKKLHHIDSKFTLWLMGNITKQFYNFIFSIDIFLLIVDPGDWLEASIPVE